VTSTCTRRRVSGPARLDGEHGVAADEVLVQRDGEAESGLQHRVGVVDVVPVVAVALLHPQAGERLQAGGLEVDRRTGGDDPVVHVQRLLGRDVQLVAEFAEIRDPDAEHPGEPDVDLPERRG
jgi:hypothetical protein